MACHPEHCRFIHEPSVHRRNKGKPSHLTGQALKAILEDVADNLFNKDLYYQQGGDMVRVGGMVFDCNPEAEFGQRISRMCLINGELLTANKYYSVSGWASVGEKSSGKPVWDVVAEYLLAGRSR